MIISTTILIYFPWIYISGKLSKANYAKSQKALQTYAGFEYQRWNIEECLVLKCFSGSLDSDTKIIRNYKESYEEKDN